MVDSIDQRDQHDTQRTSLTCLNWNRETRILLQSKIKNEKWSQRTRTYQKVQTRGKISVHRASETVTHNNLIPFDTLIVCVIVNSMIFFSSHFVFLNLKITLYCNASKFYCLYFELYQILSGSWTKIMK